MVYIQGLKLPGERKSVEPMAFVKRVVCAAALRIGWQELAVKQEKLLK